MITAEGLISLYSQGNPFLAQEGQAAFDTQQKQNKATLATTLGMEKRNQEMHPITMDQHRAAARSTNAAALIQENAEASRPPVADRLALAMKEQHAKMTEMERAQGDGLMEAVRRAAAAAKANGGSVPLPILTQLPTEWAQRLSTPQGIDGAVKITQAWYDTHPNVMADKAKQQAALEQAKAVATIQAAPRQTAANAAVIRANKYVPPGSTGGGKAPTALTTDKEFVRLLNAYNAAPEGPEKENLGQQLQYLENIKLRAIALRAEAQKAGGVDLGSMPGSKIPTVPKPDAKPTPLPGSPTQWKPPEGWK